MTTERKKIYKELRSDITKMLEGNIDNAIQFLNDLKKRYSEYTRLELEVSDWEQNNLYLYGARLETNKELSKRIEREDKEKKQLAIREKQEYERLKKKYEES